MDCFDTTTGDADPTPMARESDGMRGLGLAILALSGALVIVAAAVLL